ncbi:hypothetical protein HPB51_010697 [Rhipicephalus microplus]|uniref:Uncharacterized protein n=1 Tax=Rhipicephalus microplus TaxID=6941 RepID=A0A9J6D9H9_RHIMP|nr:hypothetical protein HPB51_010697 [Rhipicephalus microplus]
MVLYLLMGHSVTYQWYAHAAFLLAFTYCLNNTLVIISAVPSPSTQNHLQQTLYAVSDVERKAEGPIGSGVKSLRLEPSPQYITTTHGLLTALETYSLYHCTAGLLFLVGCAVFCGVDRGDSLRFRNILGLGAVAVMVLYLLMGHTVTYKWYAHAAFLLAFTYCLNNMLVIISAVASPTTQNHLQQTLYYSLYLCTAGLLFLVGCAVFYGVDRGDSLRFRNITGNAWEVQTLSVPLIQVLSAPAMCPAIADEAADDCRGFPCSRPEDTLDEAEARRISDTRSFRVRRSREPPHNSSDKYPDRLGRSRPRCSASSYSICAMAGAPWCCEPSRLLFGWPRPPVPPNGAVHH